MSKLMLSTLWSALGRHTPPVRSLGPARLFSLSVSHRTTKEQYAMIKADRTKHIRLLDKLADYHRVRHRKDPEYRDKRRSYNLVREREVRIQEPHRRREAIYRWITRSTLFCEQLPWKSYHPVIYAEKTRHSCVSCGGGLASKAWWQSANSEKYSCHPCYTKADWNEVMPEGYEDCRTKADMVARMGQLGVSPT
jgi:hypothetical protein